MKPDGFDMRDPEFAEDWQLGELSPGSLGWIMIANFIVLGLVELALAAAVGRTIGDRPSRWVGTAAVGLPGAAFVVAGVCVTDPSRLVSGAHTWHGVVHALMATVIFLIATPIAALAIARRWPGQQRPGRHPRPIRDPRGGWQFG